jgi:hypothetical protein
VRKFAFVVAFLPMTVEETAKCPRWGRENSLDEAVCQKPSCSYSLKSDIECLRSIERLTRSIKGIAVWFLVLSIISLVFGFLAAAGAFR